MDSVSHDTTGQDSVTTEQSLSMYCEVRALTDFNSIRLRMILAPGENRTMSLDVGERLVQEGRGRILMTRTFTLQAKAEMEEKAAEDKAVAAALTAERKKKARRNSTRETVTGASVKQHLG